MLDFSNPSGGNNGSGVNRVNGSSLVKRKPGRPTKLRPVPARSGLHNVQVMHDFNVQLSYPFDGQGVQ